MKIIIDVMSGDNAPLELIRGALLAKEETREEIVLVGDETVIRGYAEQNNLDMSSVQIVHADSVLMCASQRFSAMDSTMTVTFEPVSLTQSLKFRFRLQTDQGVEISSVDAILSGVAGRVKLMTGQVRNDVDNPTYKLYLNLKRLSEGDVVLYEGSANVLGLFPSDSEIYKVGPGILHLKVEASVDEDGELKQKVFYAGINLKNLIEAAELMTAAADQSGYRLNKREAVLEIPVPLQVKRDKVISASGEGFSQWFINDGEIDVDV